MMNIAKKSISGDLMVTEICLALKYNRNPREHEIEPVHNTDNLYQFLKRNETF